MKNIYILKSFIITLFLATTLACTGILSTSIPVETGAESGVDIASGTDTGNAATGGSEDAGSTTTDSDTGTDTDAGTAEENPTAFIPLPNNDSFLISNADTDGTVVAQGSIDDYDSSYGVAVVNSTQYATYQKEQNTLLAQVKNKIKILFMSLRGPTGRGNPVFPVAWAESSGCFTDNSYITEITVNAEGTIDPQAIANYNAGDELKIFYFDTTTCDTGTETAVDVIENLLYVAQESAGRNGIAADSAGNINQTDGSGNVVNISASEETGFVVQNSFDINYVMASVGSSVSALSYNTNSSDFIFQSSELVGAYDYADGLFSTVTDSSTICVNADGCSPVAVKQKGSKSYFITEYDESVSAQPNGYVRELYDDAGERIHFLDTSITDDLGRRIRFRAAKAFDVVVEEEDYKDVLVVFEDGGEQLRVFGLHGDDRIDLYPIVTSILSNISNIQDVIIYSSQPSDDSSDGAALLTTTDGVYFIDHDFIESTCEEEDVDCVEDSTTLSVDTSNPISISNLVSVVVNDEDTYAYALADDTIHVINLSSHATESTIALSDVIGHDVSFDASAILYTSIDETNYLVVSSDSLKAAIVVNLSQSYE